MGANMDYQVQVVKLTFTTPVHLSRDIRQAEQTRDFISGDTLFSALFSCGIQLGISGEELLESFSECRFSSAFPYCGNSLFFPRPFCKLPAIQGMENDPALGKKIKKIQFLDTPTFERLLNGELKSISPADISPGGKFISMKSDFPEFTKSLHERVSLDPDTFESVPFSLENLHLHPDSGLFFMISTSGEDIPDVILQSLRYLADQGIGSDRNVGYGKFEIDSISGLSLKTPAHPSHYLSLAPVFPSELMEQEMNNPQMNSAWKFKMSEGYISSPGDEAWLGLKRKQFLMLTEGTVLFSPDEQPVGLLRDVKPDYPGEIHPVWRDGRGFWLPIKISD